ncbi:MAG: thiol:disulfide interchange protein DsbA/DsbL [Rhodoferax sp.]|uniref:thiol:disulfide interchange protein DsbA/DsbL n=1 Tax=Rhodoferax sp. TaxID=50421 RepID=UPI001400532D|nr:thiol:disulfide interchange protein DsbA/DsbL [Rhodoferax sp.]NDP39764.1 thiol:disulfide interchange protein DsbA/DsbL [Rhodoferax sp.]
MKRRDFSLGCGAVLAASALVLPTAQAQTTVPAQVQGKKPEPGTDYLKLDKPAAVEAPAGKIEVVEFFWYSCSHCSAFEPTFDAWSKRVPKDVVVRRVPVAFRDDFAPQQRLFYALEAMGLVDQLHRKVFAAIHGEKQSLATGDAIVDWVAKQGVDKAKFLEHFKSFSVSTKTGRATQLQNAYKVEGVPALGVGGRFYTDGSLAKSMGRSLEVVEFLIGQVRSGR